MDLNKVLDEVLEPVVFFKGRLKADPKVSRDNADKVQLVVIARTRDGKHENSYLCYAFGVVGRNCLEYLKGGDEVAVGGYHFTFANANGFGQFTNIERVRFPKKGVEIKDSDDIVFHSGREYEDEYGGFFKGGDI